MGEDYSSAGPDDGEFDKTRWNMALGAVQSQAPCAQIARMQRRASFSNPKTGLRRRRSTVLNGHCCFGAAPPSALSKNSPPFHRNTKNTNSSPTKEIF